MARLFRVEGGEEGRQSHCQSHIPFHLQTAAEERGHAVQPSIEDGHAILSCHSKRDVRRGMDARRDPASLVCDVELIVPPFVSGQVELVYRGHASAAAAWNRDGSASKKARMADPLI